MNLIAFEKTKNKLIIYKSILSAQKAFGPSLLLLLFAFGCASATPPNFATKEITFLSEGTRLSGTIFTPYTTQAAVVLVHGSGQEKRMTTLATLLANNGIAVLTYDKRGVGESSGQYAGPEVGTNNVDFKNLNLLSSDASAAVNTLAESLPKGRIAIGLIGASQAGWIIPLAAEKNKKVKFMTIFSGALVTVKEQLRFQFYTDGDKTFWDKHSEEEARNHIANDPDRYEFVDTNPTEMLSRLSIQGFWIFGGKDIQVPVKLSIEHLERLKSKGKNYDYKLFPDLGHNTAFSDSEEPMKNAIDWIKNIK